MAKCLVCGKEVDEKNWLATGGDKMIHEEKQYYFCGLVCRQKFANNKQKYLEAPAKEGA